jgi:hypothetical protein
MKFTQNGLIHALFLIIWVQLNMESVSIKANIKGNWSHMQVNKETSMDQNGGCLMHPF